MLSARKTLSARSATALLALLLAGCVGSQPAERADLEIRGTDPSVPPPPRPDTAAASNGIVLYDGYAAARAQDGDTVIAVAERVGLSASELAAYNGLSPTSPLRGGQELALPPRPGGYGTGALTTASAPVSSPAPDARIAAIEAEPLAPATDGTRVASTATTAPPLDLSEGTAGNSGWSPELAASAIERSASERIDGTPGSATEVSRPPSAGSPLPPDPSPAPNLASPELSTYQTARSDGTQTEIGLDAGGEPLTAPAPRPAEAEQVVLDPAEETEIARAPDPEQTPEPEAAPGGGGRLARPVDGPVEVGFRQSVGGQRNDGVEFAAPAGAPVVAAEDGEVALVSEALGGLGTIVLIRHGSELLTVYGRIADVSVSKGDGVRRGQQIGAVAPPDGGRSPGLHFEVREGANSVDPMSYL